MDLPQYASRGYLPATMPKNTTTADTDPAADHWWTVPFAVRFKELDLNIPGGGAEALDCLFPADWLRNQDVETAPHPVLGCLLTIFGLRDLALLGLAAAELDLAVGTDGRLRDRTHFAGAAHELLVGLVLHRAGADLRHEPHGAADSGADWIASWPTGEVVAVEAKIINPSDLQRRARRLVGVQMSTMGTLNPPGLDRLVHVDIEVPVQEVFEAALVCTGEAEAEAVIKEFTEPVHKALSALLRCTVEPGRHELEGLGWVTISHLDGPPGVQTASAMWTQGLARAVARFGRPLRKADAQTRSSGRPGLIFVDQVQGSPFGDPLAAALALQESPQRVENIGGVFSRGGGAGLVDGQWQHDLWFDLVLGPASAHVPAPLVASFRGCAAGHLHFDPLVEPSSAGHCVLGGTR